ncbi:MAG: S-methyl-5-thioribose-1-phosphate isomerase [Micrococcales bacterium]|nr:S-methyl-5-thioribose-1-phosphate isomerase [Micrococcales bacterium]
MNDAILDEGFFTVRWHEGAVELLDQRALPLRETVLRFEHAEDVARAITDMVVRGAPAIGVTAAFGLALGTRELPDERGAFDRGFAALCERFAAARPTAVNLFWAIDRMKARRAAVGDSPVTAVREALLAEARAIHDEDVAACVQMGRLGAELVPDGAAVLTHCNAGALATAGYGTALGVVRGARDAGKKIRVFADETRPFLQGARLTAWELVKARIPVTVITDNMAADLMRRGEITCVVVGADRIARNGDVANKIGTYGVAVLAHVHGLPFYVAAPSSTFDVTIPDGAGIPIEERSPEEVRQIGGVRIVAVDVPVRHPAFDVTPAELVAALITERGVLRPPYEAAIAAMLTRSA